MRMAKAAPQLARAIGISWTSVSNGLSNNAVNALEFNGNDIIDSCID